jgi:DNA-directed RNA polymerase specialized sigma24 family protein
MHGTQEMELPSEERLRRAILALTIDEKSQLMKFAQQFAGRIPYDADDLVSESIARVLAGSRSCPAEVQLVPFICGIIRSIAFDWRRRAFDAPQIPCDPLAEERNVSARIDLGNYLRIFEKDELARQIVILHFQGWQGKALRLNLTETSYQSKLKKMRRQIDKLLDADLPGGKKS